jgi:thiol-disulfide isomerase/thioredoxin
MIRPRTSLTLVGLFATLGTGCQNAPRATSAGSATGGSPAARAALSPALTPADAERVLKAVAEPGARAVLVNVWATWCMPCREEFPDVMRFYRAYRDSGLRLVLVSADFDESVGEARRFLGAQGVDFGTFLKKDDDMRFINRLSPAWSGALPATFIYDGQGRLVHVNEGATTYDALARHIVPLLTRARGAKTSEAPS